MEEHKHAMCGTCRIIPTKHSSGMCERCRSRTAIGVLVEAVTARRTYHGEFIKRNADRVDRDGRLKANDERHLAGLEAIGLLMEDRGAERKRHRREMAEDQREAQRGAREAYSEGRSDGIEFGRWRGGD